MIRTYKRKLILTQEQANRIRSWIGACRVVYNLGLEVKQASYAATGKSIKKYDLINQLPELKKAVDWMADVPAQSLQAALERLEISYQNFFRNFKQGGGFPKFASKRFFKSMHFKAVKVEGNAVILPKIGKLKIFKDTAIVGKPKTATVVIEPAGFFICIQCEEVPKKFNSESQAVGLDMGIVHFCIDSKGGFIENPRHFKDCERRLRLANRSLARKKKGSNAWQKQAQQLSRLHYKIANVRKDFLHKESTKLAKQYSVVYMEDLKIKNMVRNKNLSKHILDCGWGMFKTMLEYKTKVVKIDPKYTSQRCFACGKVDKANRLTQAEFLCIACGHQEHADVNAAKNILSAGCALVRQRETLVCA